MPDLQLVFEFDPDKAASNVSKHGVSFREAMTVFDDPFADTFPDEHWRKTSKPSRKKSL